MNMEMDQGVGVDCVGENNNNKTETLQDTSVNNNPNHVTPPAPAVPSKLETALLVNSSSGRPQVEQKKENKEEEEEYKKIKSEQKNKEEIKDKQDHVEEDKEEEEEKDKEEEAATLLDVYEALDDLCCPGLTCVGGVALHLPVLPGLTVEGVGLVPLPLTQETAERLKVVARPAPHGRGMETIVDTSVRNTLEIDANQVSLKNPNWSNALKNLVGDVAMNLGVNGNLVQPKLYKLLLYEEGGFFKKHRDTEKAEGMFATLVIQLPSCFTGGTFVVMHNKKSTKFCLDDPATAPYQCHYIAHYADCEHEILPVESGYRLALIYSLCYTGSERTKPSLDKLENNPLVSVMNRLTMSDSLFAIPLDHQYTTLSLARLGVGALKGSDRELSKTILQASVDGWELLLVKANRTDYESGCGDDYYGGFEVVDSEKGEPEIQELFHTDGSDASTHKTWLVSQLNFSSVTDDGMILASEDTCEEMWGDGESGDVEYTGNEGASRETTYSTYLLVVFSKHGMLERMCQSNFDGAVTEIVKNPKSHDLDAILAYIQKKNHRISSENFLKLHRVVCTVHTDKTLSYWESLKTLVEHLFEGAVPSSGVVAIFTSLIKECGWNEKTHIIHLVLERLPYMGKIATCSTLLDLLDILLTLSAASQDKTGCFESYLQKTIANFERVTKTNQYHCITTIKHYKSTHQREALPQEICQRILALGNNHSWNHAAQIVKPIFIRFRKKEKNSVDHLAQEILAMRELVHHVPAPEIKELRCAMLEDFVSIITAESKNSSNNKAQYLHSHRAGTTWKNQKIDVIVQELILYGTPTIFEHLETWASSASCADLSDADTIFQKVDSSHIASEHVGAKDKCIKFIHTCSRKLMVIDFEKQIAELQQATRDGKPVFSWRMPKARTGCNAVDEFLHGPHKGPIEITVGGGVNYARSLASGTRYGYSSYSSSPKGNHIAKGYSAEITSTSKTGKNASVIVNKTQQWYNEMVQVYESNMKKLSTAQVKLRQLKGNASQPLDSQPPSKRKRKDVEVIVID